MKNYIMMQNRLCTLFTLALMVVALAGCGKKRTTDDIIVKKTVPTAPSRPSAIGNYKQTYQVEWQGRAYSLTVNLEADPALDRVSDGSRRFYDNRVTLTITRADGSEFMNREFTKANFAAYVDADYLSKSALVGFVYDRVEAGQLRLVASVGSPDKMSDDYIPLNISIAPSGSLTVSKGTRLDSGSDDEDIAE